MYNVENHSLKQSIRKLILEGNLVKVRGFSNKIKTLFRMHPPTKMEGAHSCPQGNHQVEAPWLFGQRRRAAHSEESHTSLVTRVVNTGAEWMRCRRDWWIRNGLPPELTLEIPRMSSCGNSSREDQLSTCVAELFKTDCCSEKFACPQNLGSSYRLSPHTQLPSLLTAPAGGAHLSQLTNPHRHITVTQSPSFALGFSLGIHIPWVQ